MTKQVNAHWTELVQSGNRIYIGANAGLPETLLAQLLAHKRNLSDVEILQISTLGDAPWAAPENSAHFKVNTFFISGPEIRQAVAAGRADYTPCFLSEIPTLLQDGTLPIDVALIQVSPPDEFGYCSCGVAVDITHTAAKAAKYIVAQINPKMPRTMGQSFLHIEKFAAVVNNEVPITTLPIAKQTSITERIGQYVALLVPDRATLQLGIGKIPDAVLASLTQHQDLGLHTEMLSDGVMHLMQQRVITNRYKTFHPGKAVTSFCMGSQTLYDFVHENPHVEFYPSHYVNKPTNIARNDNMISINSAIEVDLTGQVVADSIGHDFYSGIGGQMDFVTGANLSLGGKSIIALPSTAHQQSVSRIVANLQPGAGVVTSRGHVDFVVTEFGIAHLKGKSIRERSLELIRIAHPKFRAQLLADVRQHYWVPDYQANTPTDIPELGNIQLRQIQLKDEYFTLRPLNPADERRLQEFFYSHTKHTRELRYGYNPKMMSRENSCSLVSIDQSNDCALCLVQEQGTRTSLHAVSRFYKLGETTCEVAFVTKETSQGMGMASVLLEQMIEIAVQRGLHKMFALVKAVNKPMLNVFLQHGFEIMSGGDPHEHELWLSLKEGAK